MKHPGDGTGALQAEEGSSFVRHALESNARQRSDD